MILNRIGNKKRIADRIQNYFPEHSIYIEPFFGAGGMFFKKPKSKYNILNDIDSDVYNLYRQLIDNKDELIKWIQLTPITEKQFNEWGSGKRENTDILNAVRFLILSNFSLYGMGDTLLAGAYNKKNIILDKIEKTFKYLSDVIFLNSDFRDMFKKIYYSSNADNYFCYCDPPYMHTGNNYSAGFSEQDSQELFDTLQNSGMKWAMSEFENDYILAEVEKRDLKINYIGERKTIKNRSTEILITNYAPEGALFER